MNAPEILEGLAENPENPTEKLLTANQAADILGCQESTLRVSRITGLLYTMPTPQFLKIGNKAVRYRMTTLQSWIGQFEERATTSN